MALNLASPTQPHSGTQFAVQRGRASPSTSAFPVRCIPGVAAANVGATYSSSPLGLRFELGQVVHYQVVNTGNEVLNGQAQVVVTDIFGSTLHTFRPVADRRADPWRAR